MINALKALALLKDAETRPMIETLAKSDPNLRVRDEARKVLAASQ